MAGNVFGGERERRKECKYHALADRAIKERRTEVVACSGERGEGVGRGHPSLFFALVRETDLIADLKHKQAKK